MKFVFCKIQGDKTLWVIHQAYGSCGCTVPQFSKDPIEPGKKGVIKVSFNGKGQFNGRFKKSINIRSNASNALTRIYIEGVVSEKPKS